MYAIRSYYVVLCNGQYIRACNFLDEPGEGDDRIGLTLGHADLAAIHARVAGVLALLLHAPLLVAEQGIEGTLHILAPRVVAFSYNFV